MAEAMLFQRLRDLVDQLDAHVQGTPTMTLAAIAGDLDDLSDDLERLERAAQVAREVDA